MKNLLLLLFLATSVISFSQDLPTDPSNGFAFPLGTKFSIRLHPVDDSQFDYSVIAFESFEEIVDTFDTEHLFNKDGEEGTIDFYFCVGTSGESEMEREQNMRILLLMKNRTVHSLSYKSDIQLSEEGDFEETSNIGMHPNAMGTEIWPYMIYTIGLHGFEIME